MKNSIDKCFLSDLRQNRLIKGISLLTFLLFINVSLVMASEYSNSTKLTLSMKNATVETVLGKIEDQSEFRFVYNSTLPN